MTQESNNNHWHRSRQFLYQEKWLCALIGTFPLNKVKHAQDFFQSPKSLKIGADFCKFCSRHFSNSFLFVYFSSPRRRTKYYPCHFRRSFCVFVYQWLSNFSCRAAIQPRRPKSQRSVLNKRQMETIFGKRRSRLIQMYRSGFISWPQSTPRLTKSDVCGSLRIMTWHHYLPSSI